MEIAASVIRASALCDVTARVRDVTTITGSALHHGDATGSSAVKDD